MKYQDGDLVLVKKFEYKTDLYFPRLHLHFTPRLDLDVFPHLKNTYGVIIEVINHSDAWEGQSAEDDNVYFWYSQVDAKTYWFCENELTEY